MPDKRFLDSSLREIRISAEDVALRKKFLEFSDVDIELLSEIHRYLEGKSIDKYFIDLFYRHLLSFPALHKLLSDEATVNRLKAVQSQYFMRLTAGDYGNDYVADRLKVGYAHQRVGLESKWYTGAYRKYLSSLLPILREIFAADHAKCIAAYDALIKVVFFDMELALDTYFHADTQEAVHLANYDALTELPNRTLFQDRLAQEIRKAHRTESFLALLLIDLDRFKEVNDTLGHWKGDLLLIEAVRRIKGCVRETDTVARLGGDEFTVILPELSDRTHVERIAQSIIQELGKPFTLETDMVYVSASIGITICPDDAQDMGSLLKHADQAMYVAKAEGRNRFGYFTESMQQEASEKLALTNELRQALSRNELQVHYQPIVELRSGRIFKAEALLRWNHPRRGMISPATFIPLAEESGLIHEIGEWVFHQAVASVGQWRHQFGRIIQVSVNKSPVQFEREGFAWIDVLNSFSLPGDSITVEITEGLLLKESIKVHQRLLEFSDNGIEVSIDDFGTGFSALSYLKLFHIDYLKIDRSFIKDFEVNENDRALTEAIIVMAHKLGIKTVAEGVETEEQLSLLKAFGCDYVQGFLYSPAVPAAEFEQIIARQVDQRIDAIPQSGDARDAGRALMANHVYLEFMRKALDEHAILSVADAAGNIVHVNRKFADISGYAPDELLGRNHRILKSGLHPSSYYQQMWETLLSGKAWHGEVCNRRKDGTLYWVDSTVTPILDAHGLPVQFISFRTDITAIKQAKEKLQETNAELETYRQISEYQLDTARRLMEHMIQTASTQVKDVELWLQPASKMSGDLVIAQNYHDERSHVLLADAMGHGLPAALPLIPIVQAFAAMTRDGFSVREIIREMNSRLLNFISAGNFVALTLLSIDLSNRQIDIWNGGNPPALLLNEEGRVIREFTSRHPALGILRDETFDSATESFHWDEKGWLTLYSDGLADAQNVQGESFGDERIIASLRASKPHQSLKEAILAHLGGRDANDDISLATILLRG